MTESYIDLSEAEKMVRTKGPRIPQIQRTRDFGSILFRDIEIDDGPEWLVRRLLTTSALSAMWGEPGCGKSFAALHLAVCVATGRDFLGMATLQGGVIYLAAEGGRGVLKRVVALRKHFGLTDPVPFALIPTSVDLSQGLDDATDLIAEITRLAETMESRVVLVIIDTLNRVMAGGNENDSSDMGQLIRNADAIREATGAHVCFVHHGGKDRDRKTRGHSSLYGALDTAVEITVSEATGNRTATVRKQKDGEDGTTFCFRLEPVVLDSPEQEPVTSCVVVPVEAQEAGYSSKARSPTGVAAIALDALRRAVQDHGAVPPASNNVPAGVRTVSPALWRNTFYAMRANETAEANKKAFRRATDALQNAGIVAMWTDFAWLVQ